MFGATTPPSGVWLLHQTNQECRTYAEDTPQDKVPESASSASTASKLPLLWTHWTGWTQFPGGYQRAGAENSEKP